MSSLHPDHLPTEGAAPTTGTRKTLAAAPGKTPRRAAGTAKVTAQATAQATAKVTAKVTAKAATAKAATKAAASKAPGKTAARKSAAEAGSAAKASPGEAAASPAPRPSPCRRPVEDDALVARAADAPAETSTATPEGAVLAAAAAIVQAERPAVAVRTEGPAAESGPRRLRIWHRRPPSIGRRPALYMAAALVGALSVSAVSAVGPSALAETTTVSSSVSVAERLGITEESVEIVDAQATDRLGELVASRAERDADQTEAAKEQWQANKQANKEAAEEARLAAAAAAEAARPKAVLPVKGARLTSGFGARWGTLHAGIDLAAPMHTPEYAVKDGIVLEAGPASGFGLAVYIQHENGDVTVYGHMDQIVVSAGQVVKAGDTIALLGNRGQSTGPHLHFEVHKGGLDGTKIDPVPWLRAHGIDI